jgi:hypothetical protein
MTFRPDESVMVMVSVLTEPSSKRISMVVASRRMYVMPSVCHVGEVSGWHEKMWMSIYIANMSMTLFKVVIVF